MNSKVPLKKAILIIALITFMVCSPIAFAVIYFKSLMNQRFSDPKYAIEAIVQTSSEKEPLKTSYFAELLHLSVDQPTNIYQFNMEQGLQKILRSPLIKRAELKKIYPGTLYIHYALRVPIAYLVDYTNTAIDKDGVAIPFKPFFTPKILPEIYLGLKDEVDASFFGLKLGTPQVSMALNLINFLSKETFFDHCRLKRIDVSRGFASSYGQREIVVILEVKNESLVNQRSILTKHLRILRLSSANYEQELKNYSGLAKFLMQKDSLKNLIIDLRIPNLAFIKEL